MRVEAHGLPRVLADEVDVAGARRGLRAGELVRAPQQLVDGEDGEARRGVHRADHQPGDVAAHPVVVRPRPLGAGAFGPSLVRMITHLDVSADDVRRALEIIASLRK